MARYTNDSIYEIIDEFYKKYGRIPRMDEMNSRHGMPSIATFKKLTGTTPQKYLKAKYPTQDVKTDNRRRKDVADIVSGYQKFFDEHGRMPRPKEITENHLAATATFKRATGQSPGAYFTTRRSLQTSTGTPEKQYPPVDDFSVKFITELMDRLEVSTESLSVSTGLSVERIEELMNSQPTREFCDICAIAHSLHVPMELFYSRNKN